MNLTQKINFLKIYSIKFYVKVNQNLYLIIRPDHPPDPINLKSNFAKIVSKVNANQFKLESTFDS